MWRIRIKKLCGVLLAAGVIILNYSTPMRTFRNIPSTLNLQQGQSTQLKTGISSQWLSVENQGDLDMTLERSALTGDPLLSDDGVEIVPQECGETVLSLSLFGIIPLKNLSVQVLPEMSVIPGGFSIGVTIMTQGLLVVSISEISDGQQIQRPAQDAGLQQGDVILMANGEELTDAASLATMVEKSNGDPISLLVDREGTQSTMMIQPVLDDTDHIYRLGIWVRDSSAGVGTLTYYDPVTGRFGALGHAIRDLDTGSLLEVRQGEIQRSEIIDIQKGVKGVPGELRGVFFSGSEPMGTISVNSDMGLYGTLTTMEGNPLYPDPIPVASHNEVVVGDATLLATIDSDGVKEYACRIIRIYNQSEPSAKSMVIQVTDPELLSKTGGIVQGMSGSPIIQNGKLVGAVTHVFINDPTQGHAIFAEWMILSSDLAGQEE